MKSRDSLQRTFERILKCDHVYYQPPTLMKYPCILYERADVDVKYADNTDYSDRVRYTVTLIGKDPDNLHVVKEILKLHYCSYDRNYKSDNLYHDVFSIYW